MKKRIRVNGGGRLINYTLEGHPLVFSCDQADWDQYALKLRISKYGVPDKLINELAFSAYCQGVTETERAQDESDD